ncbi:acyltransferase, partial [bacterium]|nr:acyltransferase [bacterium]
MLIAISAFAINDQAAFPSPVTLVPVTGTLLVLTAGATIGGAGGNPLTTRPMVLVGDWSYSW